MVEERVDIWVFPRYSFELSDGAVMAGPSGLVAALDLAEGETMASVGCYLIAGSSSTRLGCYDVYISEQHWTDVRLGYKFERNYLGTVQESVAFQRVFEVHSGTNDFLCDVPRSFAPAVDIICGGAYRVGHFVPGAEGTLDYFMRWCDDRPSTRYWYYVVPGATEPRDWVHAEEPIFQRYCDRRGFS